MTKRSVTLRCLCSGFCSGRCRAETSRAEQKLLGMTKRSVALRCLCSGFCSGRCRAETSRAEQKLLGMTKRFVALRCLCSGFCSGALLRGGAKIFGIGRISGMLWPFMLSHLLFISRDCSRGSSQRSPKPGGSLR